MLFERSLPSGFSISAPGDLSTDVTAYNCTTHHIKDCVPFSNRSVAATETFTAGIKRLW